MSCSREETECGIRARARLTWPSPKLMLVNAGEGSKGFRSRIGNGGSDRAAVAGAVGVGELQERGRRARDGELAVVDAAVVGAAEGHEVLGGVRAVF